MLTPETPKTLSEHYASDTAYTQFEQIVLTPSQRGIEFIWAKQDTFQETDPAFHTLTYTAVVDRAEGFGGYYRYDGGWHNASNIRAADVAVEPANCEKHYDLKGKHELLQVAVPLAMLSYAFDVEALDFENAQMQCQGHLIDDVIRRQTSIAFALLMEMWAQAKADPDGAQIFVDAGIIAVTALVMGRHLPKSPHGLIKLDDVRLARSIDFIEANLTKTLRLEDIAAVACLSSYHFTRAFKAATGLTPHNYVLLRRVTRAKELLARSTLPLAQVAFEAGFASQSHMTDVFRSRVGTTPMRYREVAGGRAA